MLLFVIKPHLLHFASLITLQVGLCGPHVQLSMFHCHAAELV
jgi:hypothetical protein